MTPKGILLLFSKVDVFGTEFKVDLKYFDDAGLMGSTVFFSSQTGAIVPISDEGTDKDCE